MGSVPAEPIRESRTIAARALNCDIITPIMDYSCLLSLLERIVYAYDNNCISHTGTYSPEFRSLMGDIKDVLSKAE